MRLWGTEGQTDRQQPQNLGKGHLGNQASEGGGSEEQGSLKELTHLIWVWNMDFTASWLKDKTDTQMDIITIDRSHMASKGAQYFRCNQSFGHNNNL